VVGAAPQANKQPVQAPSNVEERKLRFRFDKVDFRHWPLHKIRPKEHERLLKRLKYFEGMSVAEAKSNNVLADYDMGDCPNKNAAEILRSGFDGQDSLTRLTVEPSGAGRLFGIREAHEFHVLWWDQNHNVWPEGKNVR
jgi:hypothetical protein